MMGDRVYDVRGRCPRSASESWKRRRCDAMASERRGLAPREASECVRAVCARRDVRVGVRKLECWMKGYQTGLASMPSMVSKGNI